MRTLPLLLLLAWTATADETETKAADDLRDWAPARRAPHRAFEDRLVGFVDSARLAEHHELLGSQPHRAGSDGDLAVARNLAEHFKAYGLEVEKQELWLYLAKPIAASVEVRAERHIQLAIKEEPVDSYAGHPLASFGWNAYSGSGDVTGEVVYANYGRKEDYERLKELGVDIAGKIVVARYGGNFRGYKAKYAEADGAIGLIMYTDPYDSGYFKGLEYPEGGYANGTYIQRGSVLTLPYRGDPLTPGTAATKDAARLEPDKVALPRIPVQPLGWKAAAQILSRMKGAAVPSGWQGALPFAYRLEGGAALQVRLMVQQERKLTKTFNVTGTLRGATQPQQLVVAGSHHDAWGFGAGDPLAGTILVLESARCFAAAAREGRRPKRSIVFAAWAAEEYGILGSTEWVEAHRERLGGNGVAYLNLDMAAMGLNQRSSAAPAMKRVIGEALRAEGHELKRFGNLGGGSDHLGFYCHLGIPSASLGGGGSKGVSYHSLYDNLDWYRKVVGSDYTAAHQLTRSVNRVLARLANGDVVPLDPVQYAFDVRTHLEALRERAAALKLEHADLDRVEVASRLYELRAREVRDALWKALETDGELDARRIEAINGILIGMERAWVFEPGLPDRPWFKSLYAASDETSGYAPWMLPGLRYAVEHRNPALLRVMREFYVEVFRKLERHVDAIEAHLR